MNLVQFSAANNQLAGSIPALVGLIAMAFFQVDNNRLTGSVPSLAGLSNLQERGVGGNQLIGAAPSAPAGANLLAGFSNLCPNALIHAPDPEWDAATGQSPWYAACVLPAPPPSEIPTLGDFALLCLGVSLIALGLQGFRTPRL